MGRSNRNQGGVSHLEALQTHTGGVALAALPLADVLAEDPGREAPLLALSGSEGASRVRARQPPLVV